MPNQKKKFTYQNLVVFLVVCIFQPEICNCQIINAASCSQEDVQAAIDMAGSGDTVIMPAGTVTWTDEVRMYDGITLLGAGIGNTVLTIPHDSVKIYMNIHNEAFRISGIEFRGEGVSTPLEIHGSPQSFRIDHNKFENCRTRAINFYEGYQYGVIDHNEFLNNGTTDIAIYGYNDSAWAKPAGLGGPVFVFIEDNTFTYTGTGSEPEHTIATNTGAKYVFRFNTISSIYDANYHFAAPIDAHGYCVYKRGTRAYEVYENSIYSEHSYRGMNFRGGTGVVYKNTLTGEFTNPIHLTNYRSWSSCGGTGVDPDSCEEGYPCKDQIQGLYVWDNTYNGNTAFATVDDRGLNTEHIQEGRDYFHYPMPGYTPYTYPHPLITEGATIVKTDKIIDKIRIIPNPVNDFIIMSFSLSGDTYLEIKLYDVTGRIIKTIEKQHYALGTHSINIDAGQLSNGIYFIRFSTNSNQYIQKFIKK